MLPATTFSPPYRFTPRYCGLLVRPLRLEPTPFLCAMFPSTQLEVGDADLGIPLPVSGLPAVVLPPLELEYVDLGAFPGPDHLGQYLGALDQWVAGLDSLPIGREEHFLEGDLRSRLRCH